MDIMRSLTVCVIISFGKELINSNNTWLRNAAINKWIFKTNQDVGETQHELQTLTNETTYNKNQKHNYTEGKGKRTNPGNFRKQ